MDVDQDNSSEKPDSHKLWYAAQGERLLAVCGYALVMASVLCFAVIAFMKVWESWRKEPYPLESWLQLVRHESGSIGLLIVAVMTATLGKRLLTSVRLADARSIPYEDLPLIRQAVIDGKADPIDQYVRLRALSGASGTFTKLGITGLPLTTVILTLIFSAISLLPLKNADSFLDLAKLTLGAFIGSFVQRQVEQRRQESSSMRPTGAKPLPDLPT
jgi:hypothetical protein